MSPKKKSNPEDEVRERLEGEKPEEPDDPNNWEPDEHDRMYFRNKLEGNLGYLIKEDGKDKIKLDRPGEHIARPFKPNEWIQEKETRKFTQAQITQIAFEADKKLCQLLGDWDKGKRDWIGLGDKMRIDWIRYGPDDPPVRAHLYHAIMGTMSPHAQNAED